jgi:predicted  nucleic acid-binding Zn-ribbon protein
VSDSQLAGLLSVQDLDVSIDQHRHRRQTLPERDELRAIDTQMDSLKAQSDRVTGALDVIARRESELEAELSATEQRAATVSRRLYGGEVSASRELQAMAADVETLKARASELEDQGLILLEEREPLDMTIDELAVQLGSLDLERAAVLGRLAEAEDKVDGEIASLIRDREESAAGIPADLLANYERLRARLGGVGAARLVGNHCDGCHLTLSSMELDRIRHLGDGEVFTCEQCSRILVPSKPSS